MWFSYCAPPPPPAPSLSILDDWCPPRENVLFCKELVIGYDYRDWCDNYSAIIYRHEAILNLGLRDIQGGGDSTRQNKGDRVKSKNLKKKPLK